jgi:predicted transcriptional regulator
MHNINAKKAKYLSLSRQNLIGRDENDDYEKLFRLMSPVPTLFWTAPGEPPILQHRFDIDDRTLNNYNRANRTIIKGRFRGGNVGYIYADELPLFMAAYKKGISRFSENDFIVLETLRSEGEMNIEMIKEITGLLSKHISASLQKLQKAFLVYEDQVDGENDRAWYILEDEFQDMDLAAYTREQAMEEVISRFAYLNVFFDESMVKSFTKFTNKDITAALLSMTDKGRLLEVSADGRSCYILSGDLDEIASAPETIPDDIYIMDLNDHLVRSNEAEIKARFDPASYKTLHYILKQGEFIGIIAGRFTFGPPELEDVKLDLPVEKILEYRQRIIAAVEEKYDPHSTLLLRYCGETRVH